MKHIWKSKCTKHTRFGYEDCYCTGPLWVPWFSVSGVRGLTTAQPSALPGIEPGPGEWRINPYPLSSTGPHTRFGQLRCRKSARRCGAMHILKLKCVKYTRFGALLEVQMSLRLTTIYYTPLTTLQCVILHYTTLHYTTLRDTTTATAQLHSTTLNYTTLRYTTLHYATLRYLPLHFTPLHYNTLLYTINTTTTTKLHSTDR